MPAYQVSSPTIVPQAEFPHQESLEWRTCVLFSQHIPRGSNSLENALERNVYCGHHINMSELQAKPVDRKPDYIVEWLDTGRTVFFNNCLEQRFATIFYDHPDGPPLLETASDLQLGKRHQLYGFLDNVCDMYSDLLPRRRFDMRTKFGIQTWLEAEGAKDPEDWTMRPKFFEMHYSPKPTSELPWFFAGAGWSQWPFSFSATITFYANGSFQIAVKIVREPPYLPIPAWTLIHACTISAWVMKLAIYDPKSKPLRFCCS